MLLLHVLVGYVGGYKCNKFVCRIKSNEVFPCDKSVKNFSQEEEIMMNYFSIPAQT
jgi:hypothetical protein